MVAPHLRIQCFGVFALHVDGVEVSGVPKPAQELLAQLAVAGSRGVDRAEVADAIWPNAESERAQFYLRRCLTQLRSILGGQRARLGSLGERRIVLDLADCWCDLSQFECASAQSDPDALTLAASFYAGQLLVGHRSEWVRAARENFRDRFIGFQYRLAAWAEDEADYDAAHRALAKAAQADPCREDTFRRLMRVLWQKRDFPGIAHTFSELRTNLRQSLDLSPSQETVHLYRELLADAKIVAPTRDGGSVGATLSLLEPPRPASPFIGRSAERSLLCARVAEYRHVTITGLGGVGKSRLAIEVARSASEGFAAGVAFADLSICQSPDEVADRIARSLGIPDVATFEALRRSGAGRILLVLDGVEHLTHACGRVLQDLQQACPQLHVLCTSRVALHTPDEHVFSLEPMSLPAGSDSNVEAAIAGEAVTFLLACAKRAAPAFRIGPDNIQNVVELCIRLDGLPLALELAAVRLRTLPIREIVANLDDRFRFLNPGYPGSERHRTLSGVLDWSFFLLTPSEQRLLVHLGIFPSTWTVSAAQAICSDSDLEAKQIPVLLASLVDHSLVVYDPSRGDGVYQMLETVRTYCQERLAKEPESLAQLQSRHADYFFKAAKTLSRATASTAWEQPNYSAAIEYFLSSDTAERRTLALELTNRLFPRWFQEESVSLGLRTALRAIDAIKEAPSGAMTEALFRTACAAHWLFKIDLANDLFSRAERMSEALGLDAWSAELLRGRGEVAANEGRLEEAGQLLNKSLERFRSAGDLLGEAACLGMLGYVKRENQEFDLARDFTEAALAINTKCGNADGHLWCLGSLAAINVSAQSPERAAPLLLQTLKLQQQAGNVPAQAWNLTMLGITHVQLHDYGAAENFFKSALALSEHDAENLTRAWPLQELGELYRRMGQFDASEANLVEALKLCRSSGSTSLEARALLRLCVVAIDRNSLASARAYHAAATELLESIQAPQLADELQEALSLIAAAEPQSMPLPIGIFARNDRDRKE